MKTKHEAHQRILDSAGNSFRERGYSGAGVDGIMSGAGLTHGGFYAHFASKESLLAETLTQAMRQQTRDLLTAGLSDKSGMEWLRAFTGRYLSQEHRDNVIEGCAVPTLISELPRTGEQTRQAFESELLSLIDDLASKLPPAEDLDSDEQLMAVFALCVGGIALARAVNDPLLSDRILEACRKFAVMEHESS